MLAQFLRGYKGSFDFITVMNMDSKLFFTYYKNLTRALLFESGEFIEGLHKEKPDTPSRKDINKIHNF